MGKARITQNKGGGLYQAIPLYRTDTITAELAKIAAADTEHSKLLLKAILSHIKLQDEFSVAQAALWAVVEQYKDGLIQKLNDVPPPLVPPTEDDPLTGLPWANDHAAFEAALLDAINAARSAASVPTITRDGDLDNAASALINYQLGANTTGHFGEYRSTPENRVFFAGYSASDVSELLAYGQNSAAKVVTAWQRDGVQRATLLNPDLTHIGIRFAYSPDFIVGYGYLWCADFVTPGTPPPDVATITKDPAEDAAKNEDDSLKKIEPPTSQPDITERLGKASAALAKSAKLLKAAEQEITRLKLEKIARDKRSAELSALVNERPAIDVWCSYYNTSLAVGDVVYTAEIPGYWIEDYTVGSATVDVNTVDERVLTYYERSWNIVRKYAGFDSILNYELALPPEIIFYNTAMEPGHLKWRPSFRYGTITAKDGDTCTVYLYQAKARKFRDEKLMELNDNDELVNIPIEYPDCNGKVFDVGDDVLVRFDAQNKDAGRVIGFRRAPRRCGVDRVYWTQIQ